MITFLLYTIIGLLANASIVKILYISIQQGQWLDKLLHWQDKLHKWDLEGKEFIVKAGGYCELCFAHWITFAGFWLYVLFMQQAVGFWLTDPIESLLISGIVNFVWYLVYVGIGTNLGVYFITKLFQQ